MTQDRQLARWSKRAGRLALAASLVAWLFACSTTTQPRRDHEASHLTPAEPAEVFGPPTPAGAGGESYGPPVPPAVEHVPEVVYGPTPVQYRPILLILGPGLARGYAHVGVIRALHDAGIPIAGIVGSEMGALVAALYALDGNLNHFEWSLQNFKEGELEGGRFESNLEKVFGSRDLKSCKIPMRVALLTKNSAHPVIITDGPISRAVGAAMGVHGAFSPGMASRPPTPAADSANSVVLVDVSGASLEGFRQEFGEPDLVIHPMLRGIGVADFDKRTDAAFRGKDAVTKDMPKIRHLVGLPEVSSPPEPQEARQ